MDHERLLDEVGRRILRELQLDARITYAELGRRVGLTLPAVAERVHRMEEAGIITGYRVVLNTEKLGLPIIAFIRIFTNDVKSGHIDTLVQSLPEVLECHRITGSDSYIMKVALSSIQHLESLIRRLLPYGQPTTSVVLSSPVPSRTVVLPSETTPGVALPAQEPSTPSTT